MICQTRFVTNHLTTRGNYWPISTMLALWCTCMCVVYSNVFMSNVRRVLVMVGLCVELQEGAQEEQREEAG